METRKSRVSTQLLVAITLILIGAGLRFLPHLPNFAPVGAIALFGGAVLGWRLAVWLPLAIMIISDIFIGFYSGIGFTWASFLCIALLGTGLRHAPFLTQVSLGALGSGVTFFVVSNFGVWLTSGMYAPTWGGLLQCYYMALPFFRTSLLADLFYCFMLFGVYEVARQLIARRQLAKSRSPLLQ